MLTFAFAFALGVLYCIVHVLFKYVIKEESFEKEMKEKTKEKQTRV